jgi:hypothetical protein
LQKRNGENGRDVLAVFGQKASLAAGNDGKTLRHAAGSFHWRDSCY